MIRLLTFFFFGLLFSSSRGQDFSGIWSGKINVQGDSLVLYFSITDSDSTQQSCFFSVPQQGVKALPCSGYDIDNGEVSIFINQLGARFWGELSSDSLLRGYFFQSGSKFDLQLRRVDSIDTPRRPQEPKRPYPYDERAVFFRNLDDGINLAGTLTTPRGFDSFDAVVLVSGSGAQNRDEEILGHKPFLVLSDYLTRRGICVLRYDDRGVGDSDRGSGDATTLNLAKDAASGVNFLRKVNGINRVGVIGHSEGGTISFMLAGGCIEGCEVDFAISLAGMAVSGEEILKKQNYDIMRASGVDSLACERYVQYLGNLFALMRENDIEFLKQNSDSLQRVAIEGIEGLPFYLVGNGVEILRRDTPWMRYFRELDSRIYLRKMTCPVFCLNGTKDLQVNSDMNFGVLSDFAPRATLKLYEGKNHLFQNCTSGMVSQCLN